MKVTMKYDQGVRKEEIVTIEVEQLELEKMVEIDYQRRLTEASNDEIVLKRTAGEIIEEWNRLEYNAWRRYHRYIETGNHVFERETQGELEVNMIDTLADESQKEERQKQEDYDEICKKIHQVLKPQQADMIIAICVDGMAVKEYAAEIGDNPINVSKRLNRIKRVLKEILSTNKY